METWHQFSTVTYFYILFITKKQVENSDERVNPDAHLLHFFENYRSFGSSGPNPPIIPRPEMPICQVSVQIVEQCLRESMALFWTGGPTVGVFCACLISIPKRFLGSSTTVSRNRFDGQLKRWDFPNHVSRYVISSYIIISICSVYGIFNNIYPINEPYVNMSYQICSICMKHRFFRHHFWLKSPGIPNPKSVVFRPRCREAAEQPHRPSRGPGKWIQQRTLRR